MEILQQIADVLIEKHQDWRPVSSLSRKTLIDGRVSKSRALMRRWNGERFVYREMSADEKLEEAAHNSW